MQLGAVKQTHPSIRPRTDTRQLLSFLSFHRFTAPQPTERPPTQPPEAFFNRLTSAQRAVLRRRCVASAAQSRERYNRPCPILSVAGQVLSKGSSDQFGFLERIRLHMTRVILEAGQILAIGLLLGGEFASARPPGPCANWVQRNPTTSPTARAGAAAAFDSTHNVVVLFGGEDASNTLADTWEWNGTNWTQRSPTTSPPDRFDHEMAYDSTRGVAVLFGGTRGSFLGDTWEWNGTDWTQRSPTTSPSARIQFGMAYDSARGVTVLFGGYDLSSPLGDTWEWNGTNWTQRSPTTNPPARGVPAMAYDSARGVTVLFGGQNTSGALGDTWEWDGTNWTQRTPTTNPPALGGPAMAYDGTRGLSLLFGGIGSNATWDWRGTDWLQLAPASSPAARYLHTLAYDLSRGVFVLFGGYDGTSRYGDTWEFNPPPQPSSAAANPSSFCSNTPPATIVLTATGGSGQTLAWYSGSCDGTAEGTGSPLTISAPASTTTYFARWEDGTCGISSCASTTVTVHAAPTCAITADSAVCPGRAGLTASAAAGAAGYVWSLSDGTISAGQGTDIITYTAPSAATSFTISLTVTDTNNCTGTCAATVQVSSGGCDQPAPTTTDESSGGSDQSAPATVTACGAGSGACGPGVGTLVLTGVPLLRVCRRRRR